MERELQVFIISQHYDEFILLLPDATEETLRVFSDQMLQAFKSPLTIAQHNIAITPSIGLALAPAHGTDFTTLIHNADVALYESKRKGKNQATLFNDKVNENSQLVEQRLRSNLN